jgi:hypothetical protein
MCTMNTVKTLAVILALILAASVAAPLRPAWADPSLEAVKSSSDRIGSLIRELTHVVQQGQRSTRTGTRSAKALCAGCGLLEVRALQHQGT